MLGVGTRELILIIVIFFLFFGTKKIPELARGIRDTIKIIRRTFSDEADKADKVDKVNKVNKVDKVIKTDKKTEVHKKNN